MSWDKPLYALFFIVLAITIYLLWNLTQWRKNIRNQYADAHLQTDVFRKKNPIWFNLRSLFLLISLFFLVLALMGPLWGEEEQRLKREGIDIVFALDLSNSMNAEDIAPNRLEKAKSFILNYLNQLGGDRVGLVIFAGEAYAVSPLTSDYAAISSFIENMDTHLLWNQGTNFAAALQESIQTIGNAPDTSKAIILISDGEDHEQDYDNQMEQLQDANIQVFAVGVGEDTPVPIPMTTQDGWQDGYKEDDNGNTVLSAFQGEELINIAQKSGGSFIKLNQINSTVEQLNSEINVLEKKSQSDIASFNKKQQFQWFLGTAILFFFMFTLTPDKNFINR